MSLRSSDDCARFARATGMVPLSNSTKKNLRLRPPALPVAQPYGAVGNDVELGLLATRAVCTDQ